MADPAPTDLPEILTCERGPSIAYRRLPDHSAGRLPGVIFLGGFASDMTGSKACALAEHCARRGQAFLRFDYSGHGASGGDFADGTIGQWRADALAVFDRLTQGPQILIGSSMGGWIMLLLALARPERIAALIGIAAAPDFTEALIWERLTPALRAKLLAEGRIYEPSRYGPELPITLKLIQDGRHHLLLGQEIAIDCSVRLLQGMADPDVPWAWAPRLAAALRSSDVQMTLIKDGDHRLSRESDLALLMNLLDALSQPQRQSSQ